MSQNEPRHVGRRREHAEAVVIRIGIPKLVQDANFQALREAVNREAESGDRPLILDFEEVGYCSSIFLGWLIQLRKKLLERAKPFAAKRPGSQLFPFFHDPAEALAAIRAGEAQPLLLCGVSPELMEVFAICGMAKGRGEKGKA